MAATCEAAVAPQVPLTVVRATVSDPLQLEFASEAAREDRALVLEAVRRDGLALQFAARELRCDMELALAAVQQNPRALTHVAYDLFTERDALLGLIADVGSAALQHAPKELQDDRDVVMAAVRRQGHALQHCSSRLQRDARVVLEAVRQCGASALDHAAPDLLRDRQFVLSAVRLSPAALLRMPPQLKSDHSFLLEALKVNGRVLDYLDEQLCSHRGFVLQAVQQRVMAILQRAPATLCSDPQFMLQVIQLRASAFVHAPDGLRDDPEFVLEAIGRNNNVLQFAPGRFRHKATFMLRALEKCPALWAQLPEALLSNEKFMIQATRHRPELWAHAPEHLRNSFRFMAQVVQHDGLLLKEASKSLRADWDLVAKAVMQNRLALDYAAEELRRDWHLKLVAFSRGGGGDVQQKPKRQRAEWETVAASGNLQEALAEADSFVAAKQKAAAARRKGRLLCTSLPADAWCSVLLFAGAATGMRAARCARELQMLARHLLPQLLHTFEYAESSLQGRARRGCHYLLRPDSAGEGGSTGAARRLQALFTSPCAPLLRVVDLSQAPVLGILRATEALVKVEGLELVRYPQTGWDSSAQLSSFIKALDSKGVASEATKVRLKTDRGTFAPPSYPAPSTHVAQSVGSTGGAGSCGGLSAAARAVLDLLPEDAPAGHEAWERVRLCRSNEVSMFRYTLGDTDIHFQVTEKKVGSALAAQRLARSCYMRFEAGQSKDDILAWRNEVYAQVATALRRNSENA